jgi:DNA polymerase V
MENHIYLCIDLKTFYASCECVLRGLDPFKTNLVVADPSRGKGAICLAISPKLKAMGIKNRCRLFEIPDNVEYITAMPQMKKYMEFSAKIYAIYLRYIASSDIYPYSIDEMFLDITTYLKLYNTTPEKLAKALMNKIKSELGLPSACGIGTNLFLAKVALDITAKHNPDNIGYLDEEKFKKDLWEHYPLTDFWQIAGGMTKRLNNMGLYTMKDIALTDPERLYKEFGINAEILIDHANGIEPVTIKDIKGYKNKSHSLSQSQILFEDYEFDKARLALTEMVEVMSLQLVEKKLVTNSISLGVGYSKDSHKPTGGMVKMTICTNVYSKILPYFLELFDKTTSKVDKIRRLSVSFNGVVNEAYEYVDLFTNFEEIEKERELEKTINSLKKKFGKNSVIKAMNLSEGATTLKRNKLIGGHNAEVEDE